MCYWNRKCCAKVMFGGLSGSWERWTGVVFSLFDHSLVVELVGARALTAGLERSPNWLWRTSFRAFGSIVVSLISRVQFQISKCWQCSKLLPVRLPEADNFGGGPGTFFKDFPQFNVYDLRFKAGRLTTFLTEFWTLMLVFIVQWEKSSIISIWGWNFRTTP